MTYIPPSGSVAAFLTGNASVITVPQGSIAAAIVSGSITASFTPPANQSVSGTVGANLNSTNASVITAIQSSVAVAIISGSVVAFQGTSPFIITGSVQGSFSAGNSSVQVLNFPVNQSVSGTVGTAQTGTVITSLVGTAAFPTADGAAIQTNLPVAAFPVVFNGTNWDRLRGNSSIGALISTASSSVITVNQGSIASQVLNFPTTQNISGSVVAFQGTGWSGSVAATILNTNLNVAGSVVAFSGGTWNSSVTSTVPSSLLTGIYAQRNDAVASFLGADLTWRPIATDSAGRQLIKPFAADDSATFRYQGSIVSGSVTLIQASAVGKRSYVTDFFVANTGSVATLITFKDGSTSILANTIAPATGGSNAIGMAIPFRTNASQDLVFSAATSTSVLYMTVQGYQAP